MPSRIRKLLSKITRRKAPTMVEVKPKSKSKSPRRSSSRKRSAAIKIQKATRGRTTRKSTQQNTKRKSAATKLQAASRGRTARKSMQGSPKSCAICLDDIKKSDIIGDQCKNQHIFHENCIDSWLKQANAKCPTCRETIPVNIIKKIKIKLEKLDLEKLKATQKVLKDFAKLIVFNDTQDQKKISAEIHHIVNKRVLMRSLKAVHGLIWYGSMGMKELRAEIEDLFADELFIDQMAELYIQKLIDTYEQGLKMHDEYINYQTNVYRTSQLGVDYSTFNTRNTHRRVDAVARRQTSRSPRRIRSR